jgi:hypothetical protein
LGTRYPNIFQTCNPSHLTQVGRNPTRIRQKKTKNKKQKSGWARANRGRIGGFAGWAGFCPPLIESTISANSYSSVGLLKIVEDFNVCTGDIQKQQRRRSESRKKRRKGKEKKKGERKGEEKKRKEDRVVSLSFVCVKRKEERRKKKKGEKIKKKR